MGANLRYEDIKDVINQIGPVTNAKGEPQIPPDEAAKEWKRLAQLIPGLH